MPPTAQWRPPWPQRPATLGVFLANGVGIGCWAAAIPRVKADLALSDAALSAALLAFAAGAIMAMPLMGVFASSLAQRTGVDHRRFRLRSLSCGARLRLVA